MSLRGWIRLARPFTLLAPSVGTLAGAAAAAASVGMALFTPRLVLALVAAALATAASNAWNQAFDAAIDAWNKPSRPIPSGILRARDALVGGWIAALAALAFAAATSLGFFLCVLAGVVGTWIYSAPPLRTKRRPLGALLTIAIPRGLLVPVAGWSVVVPPVASDPWALGVVAGLFVLGAAATKDFGDVEGDRAHGCETLPVRWGPVRAARFVAPFLVVPFFLLPVFAAAGLLHVPMARIAALTVVLLLAGGTTAVLLLRRPADLGGEGGRAAWVGMYLTLLLYQVGFALAYA